MYGAVQEGTGLQRGHAAAAGHWGRCFLHIVGRGIESE